MPYFDDSTNLYVDTYQAEDFAFYPPMNIPPIPQHVGSQMPDTLPIHYGLERQEFVAGSSTTRVPVNYESVASVAPYTIQGGGYILQSYVDESWPAPRGNLQPATFSRLDSFLSNAAVSEPSTAMQSRTVPFGYGGDNLCGQSTTALYPEGPQPLLSSYNPGSLPEHWNVYAPRQLSSGPTRTELSSARSLQPYEPHRVRVTERENAAVGPSTHAYPPVTCIGPPIPEPSGGSLSETSADAEQTNPTTEQDEVPRLEPRKPRIPNGQGKYRKYRAKTNDVAPRLLDWARKRMGNPSFNEALTEALEAIIMIRPVMTQGPHLRKPATKEIAVPSKNARKERNRRMEERRLYQELSMRYPPGEKPWERSDLLARVVQDLETHPALQDTPESSTGDS